MVEVTREKELNLEGKIGKMRLTHDPTLLTSYVFFYVVMLGDRDLRRHDICAKGGRTHEHVCDKSKCGRHR